MNIVRFGDVASRLNIHVDQETTTLEYYVGGEHIDSCDLLIHKKAPIKGSTIGYQFQFGFEKRDILFMTKNPHLRKASMVDFNGLCSITLFSAKLQLFGCWANIRREFFAQHAYSAKKRADGIQRTPPAPPL